MNESELIRKSVEGDQEAFNQLVAPHRDKIRALCLQIVKDESLADDVCQEAVLHAFTHLSGFRKEASFYTWLWKIAHNLSLNALRSKRPMHSYSEGTIGEVNVEVKESFDSMMQQLSPKHQEVFRLYYVEHVSQKEIATRLNLPPGTVRSRLHYAKKKLGDVLDKP